MPCCHIPNPVFPPSLQPDAKRFAKYVGRAPLNKIGALVLPAVLTSALHLEMKLWDPTKFKWRRNDAQRNAWKVMSNRTTANKFRYSPTEQSNVFAGIAMPAFPNSCRLLQFDGWLLDKIDGLRNQGLAHARKKNRLNLKGKNRPPELGTRGLCQKLINIFLKYELCWQVAGQWVERAFTAYPERVPDLPQFLCALHAPIDRILLAGPPKKKGKPQIKSGIVHLPLGVWLKEKKLLASNGDLKQSSDGCPKCWSKLDCLRTYYGLQLMLRRIAMETWPNDCACDDSAAKAIKRCAAWFNKTYPKQGNGPDWIQAACDLCDLPNGVIIEETLEQLSWTATTSDAAPQKERRQASEKQAGQGSGAARGGTAAKAAGRKTASPSPSKQPIYLAEYRGADGELKRALRIKEECGRRWNNGAICYDHCCLDLKSAGANLTRDLIAEIAAAGGNFLTEPRQCRVPGHCPEDLRPPGETCCWGGNGYVAGVNFDSIKDAVRYLKKYFVVHACPDNQQFDREWVDNC